MAIIAPFRGLTYDYHAVQDFSNLVAPPYDVISEDEQEACYKTHPHNVIRLILGMKKTGDSDWDNRYTRAADHLKRWKSGRTLIQADNPCMYVTSMTYHHGNCEAQKTIWGIIALVRIEEQDSGVILPHEKTFSAHKDDRLRLMRACSAQFSQIFGLYEDPNSARCLQEFPRFSASNLIRFWARHETPDVDSARSPFVQKIGRCHVEKAYLYRRWPPPLRDLSQLQKYYEGQVW